MFAPSSTLSIVLTLAGVISSIIPEPAESLPNILFVADTSCILAYVIASSATFDVAIVPAVGTPEPFTLNTVSFV